MAKTLRDLRLEAGMTLEDLAKAIDGSMGSAAHWEMGNYGPGPRQYPKLAKALKVTTEDVRLAVEESQAERGRSKKTRSAKKQTAAAK